jgi:uracil-DNA glycosylase
MVGRTSPGDSAGSPFVGTAGRLLDDALDAAVVDPRPPQALLDKPPVA